MNNKLQELQEIVNKLSSTSSRLEKEQIIDNDVLFQAYIPDRDLKSTKPTYNNLIVSQNKTIYLNRWTM